MATTYAPVDLIGVNVTPSFTSKRSVPDLRSGPSVVSPLAYVKTIYAPSSVEQVAQEALQITRGQIFPRSR